MAALDTLSALRARPDMNVEAPDHRSLHRQVFLVLRGDADRAHGALTVRTGHGHRRHMRLIDDRRVRTMRTGTIGRTGFPPRTPRLRDAGPARERRRLPIHRATCRLEFLFQFFVFATQTLPLSLRPAQILAQPLVLATQLLNRLISTRRGGIRWVSDPISMPERSSTRKYKELMATI